MKGALLFSALLAAGVSAGASAPAWPNATAEMKPWVYNWWMASAVDAAGLEAQCAALESAGVGGFHVIPIYGAKGSEKQYRTYLTPAWMDAFRLAVETASRHGLGVDMTMGCGWCFGGPQLKPEQGCWKLSATPDGEAPYVTWALTKQRVKRAGPGGMGSMMDPFSPDAMDAFLKPFSVFDAPGAAKPIHVYHDSWEYFQAGWTPGLFDAFKAKRGYDLRDHLAELAGKGASNAVARVRCDYRETLNDLVLDDVFPKWVAWAHARGIRTRNEAHGACANWLDFYALADVPETEMFAEENRDILVSKFASSAAHVTGKRLVSSESCTWLAEHFTETLADFKVFIDRLLLSGVNHMFYHGCCYSPVEAPWPGWCFYASSEMNPRNPIWRDAGLLNAYVTRCQSLFQTWTPDNDVLVYWPLHDYWHEADGFEKMMSVHNADGWFHAQPIGKTARELYAAGAAFDYVSDRQLQRLDLSRYAELVVPPCRHMPEATAAAVKRFREMHATHSCDGEGAAATSRREPFPGAGILFTRFRKEGDTLYFLVNTNLSASVDRVLVPSATRKRACAAWFMDPMTGAIGETPVAADGGVRVELAPGASMMLVVRNRDDCAPMQDCCGLTSAPGAQSSRLRKILLAGPWTLTPVCGGPELPSVRTMDKLASWSVLPDGAESPFCGTMRYRTTFTLDASADGAVELDLGEVCQSARVKVNGEDAGFAILPPWRVRFPAELLRQGENVLEVEVTSTGANRIRWNDRTGVKWKYFTDANVVAYGYKGQLDASKWPLRPCGLLGPVSLTLWYNSQP